MALAIVVIAALLGLGLGFAATRLPEDEDGVVASIDALLPQTQCAQCGYPGCRPYAEAIASGTAEINQCPPGGEAGVAALAELLGREPVPLDPAFGEAGPPLVARIVEDRCIGCTLCIQACPVDAILGAAQRMHTVIEAECTGCELCLPPCPVDCIDLVEVPRAGGVHVLPRPEIPIRLEARG
ncbi:MAG: electron transport complex subunit RsxB [Pseudomonadota bacterium]